MKMLKRIWCALVGSWTRPLILYIDTKTGVYYTVPDYEVFYEYAAKYNCHPTDVLCLEIVEWKCGWVHTGKYLAFTDAGQLGKELDLHEL